MKRLQPRQFRLTLLTALGLLPIGCGGSATHEPGGETGGSGGNGGSPSGARGGKTGSPTGARGGVTSDGGRAAAGRGGGPSSGGAWPVGGASVLGGHTGLGGSGAGGRTSPPRNRFPCVNPTPGSDPSGNTETCRGGLRHRMRAAECPSLLPRPEPRGDGIGNTCFDSQCDDRAHGYCAYGQVGVYCSYGCTKDSECGPGQVCDCGPVIGTCKEASCRTDADCSGGLLCTEFDSSQGCAFMKFACQTFSDTCGGDADCVSGYCIPECTAGAREDFGCADVAGPRVCDSSTQCAIGRPFLVDGESRVAVICSSEDWLGSLDQQLQDWSGPEAARDAEAIAPAARAELARAWARVGLMEHASVAAFARFTLELLALGAPADLVVRSTRAQLDEIGHAEAAFRLASRFAGRPVGPSELAVEGSLGSPSLRTSVELAVLEGCVGETLAALEASEALEQAIDPEIRTVLERVVQEEASHAELAFRFVRWALQRDASLAETVQEALSRAQRAESLSKPAPQGGWDEVLLAHGIVPETRRPRVRRQGLREVVTPCLNALLESARGARLQNVSGSVATANSRSEGIVSLQHASLDGTL